MIACLRAEGLECELAQLRRVPFAIELDEPLRRVLSRGLSLRRVGSRALSIDGLVRCGDD